MVSVLTHMSLYLDKGIFQCLDKLATHRAFTLSARISAWTYLKWGDRSVARD